MLYTLFNKKEEDVLKIRKYFLSLIAGLMLLVTPLVASASTVTSDISTSAQETAPILTENNPISHSFPVTLKSAEGGRFAPAEVITGVATVNIAAIDPDGTVVTNWNFRLVSPTNAKIIRYDLKLTYDNAFYVPFTLATFGVPRQIAGQDERPTQRGLHTTTLSGSVTTSKGLFNIAFPYPSVSYTLL